MSRIKVIFIGNTYGGDDGIGPYLYDELKNNTELAEFELIELGIKGYDLLSYVDDDDDLIIVDAVHSPDSTGEVVTLDKKDLSRDMSVISHHDFGIDETIRILQSYRPDVNIRKIIGIKVKNIGSFDEKLSDGVIKKIDKIKNKVLDEILKIRTEK